MTDWIMDNSAVMVSLGLISSFFLIMFWAYNPFRKDNIQEQAMIPFRELTND